MSPLPPKKTPLPPEKKERYEEQTRQLWGEINQLVVRYMRANEDIDVILALGAITAEMVYIIYNSYDGDDRAKFFEYFCDEMRTGLKQMKTIDDLKKMTLGTS